ncbi:hypothetical protein Bca4012_095456 [Brassica carinata]
MLQDGSPLGDSQTDSTAASNAKRYLLNQEYIKERQRRVQSTALAVFSTRTAVLLKPTCYERNRSKTVPVATLHFVSNRSKLLKSWQALPRKVS